MFTEEDELRIRNNLNNVRERIRKAAERCGRNPDDIMLLAVSKTVGIEAIETAIKEKVLNFGENRVQELVQKYDILKGRCNWHLIGRLQTNKVKYIIDKVVLIHSLDRLELADEIQKRAQACNRVVNTLIQVNVSGEETKAGISPDEVLNFVKKVSAYPNIKVKGLMTIAPYTDNPENVRWVFRRLKDIFVDIRRENINNIDMQYLSMGMSHDFEVAIEEGANIVRIGTSIFGERQYP
ncbi:alanine racemase domain-containing protein [Thermoclostridium stercorarium subsp. stercorarium DSM 8532]|jgi:pyridoxal phosphate enzyme (YggS family)|uniref:Pyridoxal phosphate homeostasis protein n=3 Tax=Thermoclostridium stercorarium TaxID=1510 RepID=L7VPG8_THES1|nr:YggS family pyridoxal phosphate-dependent enzyme [Thermoclostridium stercorarium]AGC68569.1 alanine racemase domain-containing protein [Thermoclostridium stercorarium subsp. stercorarium DSM 8532]AGI39585.1 pyridoxal phosphate enzyme [Thermoclostridium stercorarium subsp. stercorarium DSM 8532]ANW98919.1 YggS family pyridoxal phosphate enzyme [Thermoclostridium stercorarium subsp. thermolacticum DSM 2910]ANX01446.1 YggS family pyridoxal phosphate enzyme [Thermoclostridium stercorarium subsp.